jgi:hypothetical protein
MSLDGTSFTPASAEACAAAIPKTGCIPIMLQYGPCATRPGSLPDGATCQHASQCRSTRCAIGSGFCGTCVPTIPEGGACSLDTQCASGLICEIGTCTAPAFVGYGVVCDDSTAFCADGLVCTGTCGPPANVGAPCFRYSDCASGLQCSNASGQGGTCTEAPQPTFARPGDPCSDTSPCEIGACSNGTCPTPIGVGQACSETSGPPCDDGATCFKGTCQSLYTLSCP